MRSAYMTGALRTAVMPIGGAFSSLEAFELLSPVIKQLVADAGMPASRIDHVIMGNALSGGGNVARVAALDASLPQTVPAISIDTQCCGGLDAIGMAAALIQGGAADIVIAGGVESYSRAPRRIRRALPDEKSDQEYERPPFTPWHDRDPDMLDAAASLAKSRKVTTAVQHEFAIESHRKALQFLTGDRMEIVAIAGQIKDGAARVLKATLCDRLPILAGDKGFALTSANTALKADGAAAVLVVSEEIALKAADAGNCVVKIMGHKSAGSDPENPALAPIAAISGLLEDLSLSADDIDLVEMMEAFAVQAMQCLKGCDLHDHPFNVGGGALARGHPIGASGAINAVRLFHELKKLPAGSNGLAAIAAAGGLGSALILKRG